MFGFDEHKDQYDQVYNQDGQPIEHEGHFSHELIAGAASFAAMKRFEDDKRDSGEDVSHAFAKETIAAFAGAEADKLAETKGLDALDRERVREQATDHANQQYDQYYGNNGGDNWQSNDNF